MKAVLAGCALLLVACGHPELPPVPVPSPRVDREACAIMSAVLNDFLRPQQDAAVRRGMSHPDRPLPPTRFLLIDSTVALCRHEPVWPAVTGCIYPDWLRLAAKFGPRMTAAVESELGASLPIGCDLGADVRYLPASTPRLHQSLLQEYRPTAVIAFSAPVYVQGRTAAIFYRRFFAGGGFVRLEFSGTAWQVRDSSSWVE